MFITYSLVSFIHLILLVGKSEPPSMTKIKNLPHLCAFVEEMQRRYPTGPHALDHVTLKDTTLYGYDIPKGTRVKNFSLFNKPRDQFW